MEGGVNTVDLDGAVGQQPCPVIVPKGDIQFAVGRNVLRAGRCSCANPDLDALEATVSFLPTLVVTRADRLARSLKDLQDIVAELRARGVALRAIEQPIDTATASGKAFLDMLGVFAEFETNLRRERQREDIRPGKARGVYRGRRATIDAAAVRRQPRPKRPYRKFYTTAASTPTDSTPRGSLPLVQRARSCSSWVQ